MTVLTGFLRAGETTDCPFEWAGLYRCRSGAYALELMPGRDSTMSIVLLRVDEEVKSIKELTERVSRLFSLSAAARSPGQAIIPGDLHQRLLLNEGDPARYSVMLPAAGRYALFTQHLPEEFDLALEGPTLLDEHRFAAAHTHDDAVSSVSLVVNEPSSPMKF